MDASSTAVRHQSGLNSIARYNGGLVSVHTLQCPRGPPLMNVEQTKELYQVHNQSAAYTEETTTTVNCIVASAPRPRAGITTLQVRARAIGSNTQQVRAGVVPFDLY